MTCLLSCCANGQRNVIRLEWKESPSPQRPLLGLMQAGKMRPVPSVTGQVRPARPVLCLPRGDSPHWSPLAPATLATGTLLINTGAPTCPVKPPHTRLVVASLSVRNFKMCKSIRRGPWTSRPCTSKTSAAFPHELQAHGRDADTPLAPNSLSQGDSFLMMTIKWQLVGALLTAGTSLSPPSSPIYRWEQRARTGEVSCPRSVRV